jgi:hypothetical protein
MNAYEGEKNVEFADTTAIHSTPLRISSLVSKVNPLHLAEFAALRDSSWGKPLLPLD